MRVPGVVAGVSAIALAALLVASPASAATLPSGQRITTVGLDDSGQDPQDQFFVSSPADAVSTPVGTPQTLWPVEAVDVKDDGIGWALQTQQTDGGPIPVLRPADANTGILGPGVPVVASDDSQLSECRGLAMLPDGTLIAGCNSFNGDVVTFGHIGYLATDGTFTNNIQFEDEATLDVRAIAYDPVTQTVWAFGVMPQDGDIAVGMQIIPGGFWNTGESYEMTNIIESADFDRDGQLFAVIDQEAGLPHLGTVDQTDGTITEDIGVFTSEGAEVSMRAITVWGKAALPATGPASVVPVGLGAALLLLGGAVFVALQRRRLAA